MPTVDLGSAVVAAWLVMLGAGALNFALFALSRHRTRIRTVEVQVGDDVLVGLGVLFLVPAAIVAGFGHYILEANTGSYGRPSDFRSPTPTTTRATSSRRPARSPDRRPTARRPTPTIPSILKAAARYRCQQMPAG